MGCSFYFCGSLPEERHQEKVIDLVRSYELYMGGSFLPPEPLEILPEPDRICHVALTSASAPNRLEHYPLNFYGIVPWSGGGPFGGSGMLPHNQWVFDRSRGGLLGSLSRWFGHHQSRITRDYMPFVPVIFEEVSENRCLGDTEAFALLLVLIRRRWFPDLEVMDDYQAYEEMERFLLEFDLFKAFTQTDMTYPECLYFYKETYKRCAHLRPWSAFEEI